MFVITMRDGTRWENGVDNTKGCEPLDRIVMAGSPPQPFKSEYYIQLDLQVCLGAQNFNQIVVIRY
jgi:hypothetical protein